MKRFLILILLVLLVLAALGGWAWFAAPRLLEVSPVGGSQEIPVRSALRLTFSQPLQPESLSSHLKFEPAQAGQFAWEGSTLVFTPEPGWTAGITVTVTLEAGARAAGFFGLPVMQTEQWAFHTSQSLLAYLWPAGESADLYALDPRSGQIWQWTQTGGILDFSASADGSYLYFSRQNLQGGSDLLRLSRSSIANDPEAEPDLLLTCPDALCRLPRPSVDETWLAYERAPLASQAGTTQVWLMPLPQGTPALAGEESHNTSQPMWAASGWLAFYDRTQQGYVLMDPSGTGQWLLPNQTGESASWHPQGTAFVAAEILFEESNLVDVYASSHMIRFDLPAETAASSPAAQDLTQDVALEDARPVYSPDGSRIAFARKYLDLARWTPGRQLWVISADGSEARALTNEPLYTHYDFAWSPDGEQIAYVRFHQTVFTLPPELWVIGVDGSAPLQLVIGGYAPQWAP
ncbi:MAG: Ig-like domain-containing protein [Anaerolineales bacterium]|jgi:Tol biopolymer transport system component|nr:Ig-like domain-containing protein [Anaerolineales bacterium]